MELWEDQARSVPKRQARLEDSRKAPEPGKLSSSMEEEEEQQQGERRTMHLLTEAAQGTCCFCFPVLGF